MYCGYCGKNNSDDSTVCAGCGSPPPNENA